LPGKNLTAGAAQGLRWNKIGRPEKTNTMKPKVGGRPTPAQQLLLLERRQQVKELWVRQTPQWRIAKQLDISQATVCRDLKAIRRALAAALADDAGQQRLLAEVAKLDALEAQAWAAWERSCADAEVRLVKSVKTEDGKREEASKREEGQAGDPRFLAEVRACVKQRCELLGLIVEKHEHTGKDGAAIFSLEAVVRELARLENSDDGPADPV
jgi:predicted DNA-binding protein (UPF0251 family)